MRAISKLHDQRTALIADCEAVMTMLADNTDVEIEWKRIETEQKTVEALVDALIRENAAKPMDQETTTRDTTDTRESTTLSAGSSKSSAERKRNVVSR